MRERTTFDTGSTFAAGACTLILACSSGATPAGPDASTTPPGVTAVTSPPYAACAPLQPGSYEATGAYAPPATASCASAGKPTPGAADAHCAGRAPQPVSGTSCAVTDAGPPPPASDAGAPSGDAGASPAPGPCGENSDFYGGTQFGTEGDDDDCKYHLSYTASPICQNNGTYFVVEATYLATNAPATNASASAELCLSDTHPAPAVDGRPPSGKQQVVEGPPGTYTIGPVQFDAPGDWTVRFHFSEFCCDVADDSPHGHAAFHVTVP